MSPRKHGERPRVAIIFRNVFQYRRRFFELLRDRLDERGVELVLIYGEPDPHDAAKQDSVDVPWGHKIRNRVMPIGSRELFWQPAWDALRGVELVIVEPASKLLLNYLLFAQQLLGIRRMAFWGHGFNARLRPGLRAAEFVKRVMSRRVHWWFAYNEMSREAVRRLGFPPERITDVQNAIDTEDLARVRSAITPAELERVRAEVGIRGANVCAWMGGMSEDKRLAFLVEACDGIRARIPDFELVVIGTGPDRHVVEEAAATRPWLHRVGPKFDDAKVPYILLAKLLLLPAAVGLVVLDSFVLEVPIITVAERYHGPEIDYLEDGVNGLVLPRDVGPQEYAAEVIRLLEHEERLASLREGCRRAARRYTIGEMVDRFADGVLQALEAGGRRPVAREVAWRE